MAQTEAARAEAFAKQADRSRELAKGYVEQAIANAAAMRETKAIFDLALSKYGIPHRWVGTTLELRDPVTGEWIAGPDLRGTDGVDVVSGEIAEDGRFTITLSNGAVIEVAEGLAKIDSPEFTGSPTVPTAAPGTDDETAANTEFVTAAIAALTTAFALPTLAKRRWVLGLLTQKADRTNTYRKDETYSRSETYARSETYTRSEADISARRRTLSYGLFT